MPPLLIGAVKAIVALVCPLATALPIVGGPAIVSGEVVMEFDTAEAADVPTLFIAVMVKV